MSAQSTVLAGRRAAERTMLDACTIASPLPQSQWTSNPAGDVAVTYAPAKYSGPCKVQTSQPLEQTPEAGGAVYTVQRYAVHIPVGSCEPAVHDVVTITSAVLDAHMVQRRYRVVALLHKTAATAYRLAVEEIL